MKRRLIDTMWKINIRKLNKGLDPMDPHVIAIRRKFNSRWIVRKLKDEK
jgi:hypothetical protein